MANEQKHHFRKVFKSDYLGSADIEDFIEEGKKLVFTIKEVKQQYDVAVAGKKGNFNIAYFVEPIKPFVLNATNSKVVKGFAGGSPFVEDWNNILVELYIDQNVKMKGDIVQGLRISPIQPKAARPQFTEANFDKAMKAAASIESIKKIYDITPEMETKYKEFIAKAVV